MGLAQGRKGPARGGVLDGAQAEMLRSLIAEQGTDTRRKRAPARGLAKLLRRNPTEAERILWDALVNDRRFAGRGFKRQTPIGPHIADFVSFPLRCVIDLAPTHEDETASQARDAKRIWLEQRGYKVVLVTSAAVEADVGKVLDALAVAVNERK
jgi:tRNA/rRNA methyltransferase